MRTILFTGLGALALALTSLACAPEAAAGPLGGTHTAFATGVHVSFGCRPVVRPVCAPRTVVRRVVVRRCAPRVYTTPVYTTPVYYSPRVLYRSYYAPPYRARAYVGFGHGAVHHHHHGHGHGSRRVVGRRR